MAILKIKGCMQVENNSSKENLKQMVYGCDDKHAQGEKCHNCIYNLSDEKMISCMFHNVE